MEPPLPAAKRPSTHEARTALFHEAAAVVEAEFAHPLTADEVARRIASSPRQLHRAFSEQEGTTFRSFLMRARMTHAADLLASTDLPVGEVALRCGYRQASHFTKVFKRAYDATPSEFRATRGGSGPAR